MAVCDVCCFNDGKRFGYVALLDSVTNGKRNAVKIFGNMFGSNFKFINLDLLKNFNIKTLRKPEKFGRYIKSLYPQMIINPINVNGLVFDLPYIYLGNTALVSWEPIFEEEVSTSSFKILHEGLIVEYNYHQPIFISVLSAKRHIPKTNEEQLLINCSTGMVTRVVKRATATSYIEAQYHVENGKWVCDGCNEVPIAGYKMR